MPVGHDGVECGERVVPDPLVFLNFRVKMQGCMHFIVTNYLRPESVNGRGLNRPPLGLLKMQNALGGVEKFARGVQLHQLALLGLSHLSLSLIAAGSRVRFGLLDGAWVDDAALHLSSFTCVTFLTPLVFTARC